MPSFNYNLVFILLLLPTLAACDAAKEAGGSYLKGQQAQAENGRWSKLAQQRIPEFDSAYASWEANDEPSSALSACQSGSIVLDYYHRAKNKTKISAWEEKIAEPCAAAREFQGGRN